MEARNVIITAATGYDFEILKPFLFSMHTHCPDVHLVILADKTTLRDRDVIASTLNRVEFLKVDEPKWQKLLSSLARNPIARKIRKFLSRSTGIKRTRLDTEKSNIGRQITEAGPKGFDISVSRWYYALNWLREKNVGSINGVLLTDCRDVVFQGNPFTDTLPAIVAGEEAVRIGEEHFTTGWIRRVYGESGVTNCSGKHVICSGVILGQMASMKQMLEACWLEASKQHAKFGMRRGFDQGMLNYLIHATNCFPAIESANKNSRLLVTLDASDHTEYELIEGKLTQKMKGHAPIIVHQYDRIGSFKNALISHYWQMT